jgi:hypothetical protein
MTILRRAPREVYRVYDEDEFFAYADREERFESGASAPRARRLHRLAGATMLLAAAGAIGGLTAIAGLSSMAGARRRGGARQLVASVPPASSRIARGQIWPARDGSNGRDGTAAKERRAAPVREMVGARWAASARPAAVSIELASAASAPPAYATASARSRPSGRSEFGFER